METLTLIYIGSMFLLCLAATNNICKKSDNICKKSDKIFNKKRFKHYRFH